MTMPLRDTVALVTGASSGIGAATARRLAAEGAAVALVARRRDKLEELAASAKERCRVVEADLADHEHACDWVDAAEQAVGPVDVLINNAGFGLLGPFAKTSSQRELEIIQVNVTALTELTKLALPPMLERRQGWILNVASTASASAPPPDVACFTIRGTPGLDRWSFTTPYWE